ncbi:hypothetical protein ABBQ32_009049 [Trebouxia sp. C0010 RCD-2024]
MWSGVQCPTSAAPALNSPELACHACYLRQTGRKPAALPTRQSCRRFNHTNILRFGLGRSGCQSQKSSGLHNQLQLCKVFARTSDEGRVPDGSVSVVFLAGGSGKRMKASMPKQYLNLLGQPIAMHSLNTFGHMPEVGEIIVVCDPSYRDLFQEHLNKLPSTVKHRFALPGIERQDSVYSGLQEIRQDASLVAVHDSARPLLDPADAAACMLDAQEVGAAVLGVPVKPTIKEVDQTGMVTKTLVRADLWEVQTPQVIQPGLLREGFELVRQKQLDVTDDVSIVEALGRPVKVTRGSYTNIKVTTPDDMLIAEGFLMSKGVEDSLESSRSDFSEASMV